MPSFCLEIKLLLGNGIYSMQMHTKNQLILITFCLYSTGMVSLYYGYKYRYFSAEFGLPYVEIDFSSCLMGSVIFTTIISLFGAFIAFWSQMKIILNLWNVSPLRNSDNNNGIEKCFNTINLFIICLYFHFYFTYFSSLK